MLKRHMEAKGNLKSRRTASRFGGCRLSIDWGIRALILIHELKKRKETPGILMCREDIVCMRWSNQWGKGGFINIKESKESRRKEGQLGNDSDSHFETREAK